MAIWFYFFGFCVSFVRWICLSLFILCVFFSSIFLLLKKHESTNTKAIKINWNDFQFMLSANVWTNKVKASVKVAKLQRISEFFPYFFLFRLVWSLFEFAFNRQYVLSWWTLAAPSIKLYILLWEWKWWNDTSYYFYFYQSIAFHRIVFEA